MVAPCRDASSVLAWLRDRSRRYPAPRPGKALEDVLRDKKIYYHAIGTSQSADHLIYDRPEEPMLFIDVDIDETARARDLRIEAQQRRVAMVRLTICDRDSDRVESAG